MWFNLAADVGYDGAAKKAAPLSEDMTASERMQASLRQEDWRNQACEWNAVSGLSGQPALGVRFGRKERRTAVGYTPSVTSPAREGNRRSSLRRPGRA